MVIRYAKRPQDVSTPIHASGVGSFAGALVARISKDNLLFTVQQCVPLRDIVDVCRRADDRVHQARLSVHPLLAFMPKRH